MLPVTHPGLLEVGSFVRRPLCLGGRVTLSVPILLVDLSSKIRDETVQETKAKATLEYLSQQ
jgi:hypothetical protein